jgi:HAD superfamily hydrolase (TIGR01662 family)
MGRYGEYFKDIWKLQSNRKIIGLNLFGVLVDNSKPFTPGDAVIPLPGVDQAIQILTQKGYDFILMLGQPVKRTRLLENHDFENIISGAGEFISQLGGRIRNVYYCPGTDKNDFYVKPNTGMWERAANENKFDWEDLFFVGSEINDIKAAAKMKAKPILIKVSDEIKTKGFELTNQIKILDFKSLFDFAQSL